MSRAAEKFISGRAASGKGGIDWESRRKTYLQALQTLYTQIEQLLKGPLQNGKAKLRREKREITENYLGTYGVEDLILEVGGENVRFVPRGRNIVGAAGRVDVLGDAGDATLVVQPGEDGGRWSVVASRQPTLKIVPFDDASFAELLKTVMAP